MQVQIKGKEIFAPLKDKWLANKPEEEVRQKYICRLVNNYGYSIEQMAQEVQVTNSQRGQGAARADIVIWKNCEDKANKKNPLIIVECKAESVTIHKEDYYQESSYEIEKWLKTNISTLAVEIFLSCNSCMFGRL